MCGILRIVSSYFPNLLIELFSFGKLMVTNWNAAFSESFRQLKDYFSLFFFLNQKWVYGFKDRDYIASSNSPFMDILPFRIGSLDIKPQRVRSKVIGYKRYYFSATHPKLYDSLVVNGILAFPFSYCDTSFSVNDTSDVGNFLFVSHIEI